MFSTAADFAKAIMVAGNDALISCWLLIPFDNKYASKSLEWHRGSHNTS